MDDSCSIIVNSILQVTDLSYLELGLKTGGNFKKICCSNKTSVDVEPKYKANYIMTTDKFFENNKKSYDIIFIDADHHYEQVLKDFNNAVAVCNKFVILHDLVPSKKEYVAQHKCGDAYKLLWYLAVNTDYTILTLNCDQGLTFVKMPINPIAPPEEVKGLRYEEFEDFIKGFTIYTIEQMQYIVGKNNVL